MYQRLDGVDIALYCLYVQEYGEDNAPPNKRTVYLSYLDSVKYFRCVCMCCEELCLWWLGSCL